MLWDQAHALRKLVMDSHGRRARVVAITSGKGGVGKSSVAVNLAIRLSRMGRRVVLLDADLGAANADVLCNLTPGGLNLAHVVAGRAALKDVIIDAPGGFRLVPGASGLAQMAALNEFERARLIDRLHELEDDADLLLVDTGAGISPNVLSFVAAADQQMVVTAPEPTAITDAYALIKTAYRRRSDLDVRVLVNMAGDSAEARAVFDRLDAVCRRFLAMSIRYAGYIPHDPCVATAVRQRVPFAMAFPDCAASLALGQLSHRMDRYATEPQGEGLLKRMAMWLAG